MLAKNERSNVRFRRLSIRFEYHTVDDGKFDVRIVVRDSLHYRTLSKANADYQVEVPFGECTHCRFDRGGIAGFDVVEANIQVLFGLLYALPGSRVERPVVLAADVENDADLCIAAFALCISANTATREQKRSANQADQRRQESWKTKWAVSHVGLDACH